jgi:hypothetical protein
LAVFCVKAQTCADGEWARLENDSGDFSIAIPSNYRVLADAKGYKINKLVSRFPLKTRTIKIDDVKRITAYCDGATFLIESYRTDNPSDAMEILGASGVAPQNASDLAVNGFQGRESTNSGVGLYTHDVILGSKDHIYRVFGGARDERSEILKYVFSSIRLNGQTTFIPGSSLETKIKENPVKISGLRESPILLEKAEKGEEKTLPAGPVGPRTRGISPRGTGTGTGQGMVIVYKPRAEYTDAARKNAVKGTVSLRIAFGADGQVDKITEIEGLPHGLTEAAVRAARLVRFLPLETDGKPVMSEKVIQYSFSIY